MTRDNNGPIEALSFRLLLKINEHTAISRKGSNTATAAWSKVLGESTATLHERNNSVFLETVLPHTRRKLSSTQGNFSCISYTASSVKKRLLRNTFAIEGVFLAMLDDVSMSLASANRHKRKYV